MAAIGTMIQAAPFRSSEIADQFSGGFPRYSASFLWGADTQPSQMTYYIVIRSTWQALNYAWTSDDYRELRGLVKEDGQIIALGGYGSPDPHLSSPRNSSAVASS